MTIKQNLENALKKLKENNIIDSNIKARILLSFILDKPKEYLIINSEKDLEKNTQEKFNIAITRLIKGEPLQHITEKQEFMKMDFFVNKEVLIPRPDTEILVEEVIELLRKNKNPKVLDLCTGSGIVAITIAKYIRNSKVTAIDVSEKALEIAKKNAKANKEEIRFIKSNMFEKLSIEEKYNLIVSNPPYIDEKEMKGLDEEVKREPHLALYGGIDGLDYYRIIIQNAYKHLEQDGYLCLEIGYNQKESVIKLIKESGKYKNIYSKKDLCGNDRIIICS